MILTYNVICTKKCLAVGALLFVCSLAVFGAMVEPPVGFDLTRHYIELDIIRNSDFGVKSFVFHSDYITDGNYKYMFAYNIYRYCIAKLFPNAALQFFTIIIVYSILVYIILETFEGRTNRNRVVILSFFMCFAFLPYLYVYSGIRNALAASIVALALYLLFYKNLSWIVFFVIVFIAGTIHPVVIAAGPFAVISFIKPKGYYLLLIPIILSLEQMVLKAFKNSSISLLKMVGTKYYNYINVYNYDVGRAFTYAPCIICIVILVSAFIVLKNWDRGNINANNFIIWYIIFALCNINNQQVFMRLLYVLACFSPIIINNFFNKDDTNGSVTITLICPFIIISMGAYVCYKSFLWMM